MMDWTDPIIAKLHDEMNKGSFDNGTIPSQYGIFNVLEKHFRMLLGDETKPLRCLDIGCGAGWQAVYLDRVGLGDCIEYIGVDISPHMCERGKRNYPKGTFIVGDINTFQHEKVPVVMSCGVIEGFPRWKEFIDLKLSLSSKWVFIHKIFLSAVAPTEIVTRYTYTDDHKEFRVTINKKQFEQYCDEKNLIIESLDIWETPCASVLLRRQDA